VPSRLTFDPTYEGYPIWSPDGSRIAFISARSASDAGIRVKSASGGSDDTLLLKAEVLSVTFGGVMPNDWSPDGRSILYQGAGGRTGADLWILPLSSGSKPFPIVQGPSSDTMGAFSPDGRWIAYVGAETNPPQVYVQALRANGGHFQVSRNGGTQPRWRGDGKELFFVAPDGTMMASSIDTSG